MIDSPSRDSGIEYAPEHDASSASPTVSSSEPEVFPPLTQLLGPDSIEIINPRDPKLKPQPARVKRVLAAALEELPSSILLHGVLAEGDDRDVIAMKVGVHSAREVGELEIAQRILAGKEYYAGYRRLVSCLIICSNSLTIFPTQISGRFSPARTMFKTIGNHAIRHYDLPMPRETAKDAVKALKLDQSYIYTDPTTVSTVA